jgi:hypothetical protein
MAFVPHLNQRIMGTRLKSKTDQFIYHAMRASIFPGARGAVCGALVGLALPEGRHRPQGALLPSSTSCGMLL